MSRHKTEFMIRKIVVAVIVTVVLIIAYNLLVQITDALKSEGRLSAQAETVYQLEARNKQLKNKLTQVLSPEFIEEQARNKLGLGKAGETMVIIPEEKLKSVMGASQSAQVIRLPNWLGWWRVFFR